MSDSLACFTWVLVKGTTLFAMMYHQNSRYLAVGTFDGTLKRGCYKMSIDSYRQRLLAKY
ncbi:Uncharacterised protein [Vibrio cholerae]|nr:Uncharacterised protein [Vibrio cholerae]